MSNILKSGAFHGKDIWSSVLHPEILKKYKSEDHKKFMTENCMGGGGDNLRLLESLLVDAAKNKTGDTISALPLYLVNYIFDGSELTKDEMKITIHETA